MSNLHTVTVTETRHWTDRLFSFTTTRDPGFRFESGQFVTLGLEINSRPLLRAYSIASASYEDHLEFFSIKVEDGPLTSVLKDIRAGDSLLMGRKPTGTLQIDNLRAGRNLYLIATGTGLAPFLSIVRDFAVYERFERIVVCHGCRYRKDLAYADLFRRDLLRNELVGERVRSQLNYCPWVTREPATGQPRLTDLISDGRIAAMHGLAPIDSHFDRFMICGSLGLLLHTRQILHERGFIEGSVREPGQYVYEKAFVD